MHGSGVRGKAYILLWYPFCPVRMRSDPEQLREGKCYSSSLPEVRIGNQGRKQNRPAGYPTQPYS